MAVKEKDPLAELARILAKAENNPNDAEAELAFERAAKLSARYGIDLAVARAHLAGKEREQPVKEKVKVGDVTRRDNTYMMELFTDIAQANDLRCTIQGDHLQPKEGEERGFWRYSKEIREDIEWSGYDLKDPAQKDEIRREFGHPDEWVSKTQFKDSIYCNLYGFPSDIEMTKKLYAVAVVMMTSQADKAIRAGVPKSEGINAKAWRINFYVGFAHRLNQRLLTLKREAEREAMAEIEGTGERSTALVLADKKEEVDEFFKSENQHFYRADGTQKKGRSWSGGQVRGGAVGYDAGWDAADKVNLGTNDNALAAGARKGIGA